jgi:hypothetical protein
MAGHKHEAAAVTVVQERQDVPKLTHFYQTHGKGHRRGGTRDYGSAKRSITNLERVADELASCNTAKKVQIVVDDGASLKTQIQQYANADTLVLGHGAGMLHLLWMKSGSRVVELIPLTKVVEENGAAQGCVRLAKLMKFDLKRIKVSDDHARVRVKEVVDALKQ